MNREERQRKQEVEWTQRFFNHHFGFFPEFELLPTNSQPDVCVKFQGKRVGIELTRAIDSIQAGKDSFSDALLAAATKRHAELNGHQGRVTVSFQHNFEPGANHRHKDLGEELGRFVASTWKDPRGVTILNPARIPLTLRETVAEVRAFSVDGATETDWQPCISASVQGITNDRLAKIIAKKEQKISLYQRMSCDELWLLIYARPRRSAEMFDVSRGFRPSDLHSRFDRTFFYDFWRSMELATH